MVQVFHLNRRLFSYKITCIILIGILFIFIHIFEIVHHFLNICQREEPIDAVYTWVNGSDPKFLEELNFYLRKYKGFKIDSTPQRYDDKNELKFSLRSLEKYAPWIRHVYIVTNGQIPYWLNLDYEKITLVTHNEIFTDTFNVPTFSSPAIEAHLHRIPGLSKRFIYFNDDVFLRSPIYKEDFYSSSRGFLIYLAWILPMCSPECSWLYVGDGQCDGVCNNPSCQMDGGDCTGQTRTVIGDVIVKFDDYETTDAISTNLTNFRTKFLKTETNVSDVIAEHNKKIILLDKLKRRKTRKREIGNQVDAYAESLQHTNRILNDYYGFSVRKVPAHAPIMIDKDIMGEMATRFDKHFKKTARNRIRSSDDVQFAFAYYYFLIHEKNNLTLGDIFDKFDTDLSGVWSDTEVRTVITKLYSLPITDQILADFSSLFSNCTGRLITREFIENCAALSSFLKTELGREHKNKFELIRDAEKKHVFFKMLTSNVTEVQRQLDEIRKREKKFVCLNDNLDYIYSTENEFVKNVMLEFYLSLFPTPSKFELPENYKNRFLYMEDYLLLIRKQNSRFLLSCLLLFVIIFIVFLNFFRRRVCELIETFFC